MSKASELLRPTALGPTRPSLVEDGASCFCIGACRNGPHSAHENGVLVRPSRTLWVLRTVPDSTGNCPLQAVRSVQLLPNRHSATANDARFLSSLERASSFVMTKRFRRFEPRLNNVRSVANTLLQPSRGGAKEVDSPKLRCTSAVSPPCSRPRRLPRKVP